MPARRVLRGCAAWRALVPPNRVGTLRLRMPLVLLILPLLRLLLLLLVLLEPRVREVRRAYCWRPTTAWRARFPRREHIDEPCGRVAVLDVQA